ncbi:hypothetical protein M885DRAFT_258395 [Pelagophyceae sp. CCMP2097]|nr:hypothetical protein M885DRAFT_258395 [Pelagophyceae sp. CCMP2097]
MIDVPLCSPDSSRPFVLTGLFTSLCAHRTFKRTVVGGGSRAEVGTATLKAVGLKGRCSDRRFVFHDIQCVECAFWTVEQGTVEQGTVEQGTVEQGTVEQGTVEQGTVEQGPFGPPFGPQGAVCRKGPRTCDSKIPARILKEPCPFGPMAT